jgi:hypothetical protein
MITIRSPRVDLKSRCGTPKALTGYMPNISSRIGVLHDCDAYEKFRVVSSNLGQRRCWSGSSFSDLLVYGFVRRGVSLFLSVVGEPSSSDGMSDSERATSSVRRA